MLRTEFRFPLEQWPQRVLASFLGEPFMGYLAIVSVGLTLFPMLFKLAPVAETGIDTLQWHHRMVRIRRSGSAACARWRRPTRRRSRSRAAPTLPVGMDVGRGVRCAPGGRTGAVHRARVENAASNKGLLPILWELFPGHPNLLPAYETAAPLGGRFVRKPKLGREGANVAWMEGGVAVEETDGDYGAEGHFYQAVAELPAFDGHDAVCGVWVVDHEPAGLGLREDSRRITGEPEPVRAALLSLRWAPEIPTPK